MGVTIDHLYLTLCVLVPKCTEDAFRPPFVVASVVICRRCMRLHVVTATSFIAYRIAFSRTVHRSWAEWHCNSPVLETVNSSRKK